VVRLWRIGVWRFPVRNAAVAAGGAAAAALASSGKSDEFLQVGGFLRACFICVSRLVFRWSGQVLRRLFCYLNRARFFGVLSQQVYDYL
jgi:hypothetical protein